MSQSFDKSLEIPHPASVTQSGFFMTVSVSSGITVDY